MSKANMKSEWKPKIEGSNGIFWVQSQKSPGLHYTVDLPKRLCNCAASQFKRQECKHVLAAMEFAKAQWPSDENNRLGIQTVKPTPDQDALLARISEGSRRISEFIPRARAINCGILADDLETIAKLLASAVDLQRRCLSPDVQVRADALAESNLPFRVL